MAATDAVTDAGETTQEKSCSLCVSFFSEFDDSKGPIVAFSEPEGSFEEGRPARPMWELFSEYVISGHPMLDQRVVQVRTDAYGVVCLPVVLRDDEKYRRNSLLFAVGVAVSPGCATERVAASCRGVLLRCARALRAMEVESSLLSRGRDDGPRGQEDRLRRLERLIPGALKSLRDDVLGRDETTVSVVTRVVAPSSSSSSFETAEDDAFDDSDSDYGDDPNVFSLRRPPVVARTSWTTTSKKKKTSDSSSSEVSEPAAPVEQWEVPVLLARPRDLLGLGGLAAASPCSSSSSSKAGATQQRIVSTSADAWDLSVQQVIPKIDGIRNVRQLARSAFADVDIVARSLRVLRHYGCLAVVDTFQYGNTYRATRRAFELAASTEALRACAAFVLRKDEGDLQGIIDASYTHTVGDHHRDDSGRRHSGVPSFGRGVGGGDVVQGEEDAATGGTTRATTGESTTTETTVSRRRRRRRRKHRRHGRHGRQTNESCASSTSSSSRHVFDANSGAASTALDHAGEATETARGPAPSQKRKTHRHEPFIGSMRSDTTPATPARGRADDGLATEEEEEEDDVGNKADDSETPLSSEERVAVRVLRLYCAFKDGRTVKDVLLDAARECRPLVDHLDHRAFAAFGAIHGILHRVHRYPVAFSLFRGARDVDTSSNAASVSLGGTKEKRRDAAHHPHIHIVGQQQQQQHLLPPKTTTTTTTTRSHAGSPPARAASTGSLGDVALGTTFEPRLHRALDLMNGRHCMDEICSDLEMPAVRVEAMVRDAGYDVKYIFV